jgi:hypothetical protein
MKIALHADIKETNRYEFMVEVDENLSQEEQDKQARIRLEEFLRGNCPYPFQSEPINGVQCVDRESGMQTHEVELIDVNE